MAGHALLKSFSVSLVQLRQISLAPVLRGVPTGRRSYEKRLMRKFGAPMWHNKLILPKDLQVCVSCGHYHEKNRLCC